MGKLKSSKWMTFGDVAAGTAALYQTGSQKALEQRYYDWLSAVVKGLEQH